MVVPLLQEVGGSHPALLCEGDTGGPGEVSATEREIVRSMSSKVLTDLRQLTLGPRLREVDLG